MFAKDFADYQFKIVFIDTNIEMDAFNLSKLIASEYQEEDLLVDEFKTKMSRTLSAHSADLNTSKRERVKELRKNNIQVPYIVGLGPKLED